MDYFLYLLILHHQHFYYNVENKFAKHEIDTCSTFNLLST